MVDRELRRWLRALDSIEGPTDWPRLSKIPGKPLPTARRWRAFASAAVALALAGAGLTVAAVAFFGASETEPGGGPGTRNQQQAPIPCTPLEAEDASQIEFVTETKIGLWLFELLQETGAPEGWVVTPDHLAEGPGGFRLDLSQYEGRFEVGVGASRPDWINYPDPPAEPQLAERGDAALYGGSTGAEGHQSFFLVFPDLWIGVSVFPEGGLTWEDPGKEGIRRDAMVAWFHVVAEEIERTTPPACLTGSPGEEPALGLWERFGIAEGHEVGRYESLGAMARGAHAVVGAVVTGVDGDHIYEEDDPGSALRGIRVTLQATEVLKGDVGVGDAIPVVVGLAELDENVEERFAELVGDEGIFFLVPAGAPRPEFGIGGEAPEEWAGDWTLATSQGAVIDDRGTAVFATDIVDRGFPEDLDGMPFPEVRSRIRSAIDEDG